MNTYFNKRQPTSENEAKKHTDAGMKKDHVPWVEKYRPRQVKDLVFQSEVVQVLQKVIDGADLPNLLLYGPPGTGKTSAAVALCRQLFRTTETYKDRVLEMNASDERGINVVRTRIKEFSQRAVAASSIHGCAAALKVIILDEADAMTTAAQAALRRTIEKYSKTTRFFLICNYISRIIDPLTSRCAKFRFKPLPIECQVERLERICQMEGVEVETDALSILVRQSEGDLRKSVTSLQAIAAATKRLRVGDVNEMSGRIPDDEVSKLLSSLRSSSFSVCGPSSELESFRRAGHGVGQLLFQLHEEILRDEDLNQLQKAEIFDKMALSEYRLQDGGSDCLALLNIANTIHEQYKLCRAN